MISLGRAYTAVVLGASGGIGSALVTALAADPACAHVEAVSRSSHGPFDLEDEPSIAHLADRLRNSLTEADLIFIATGALTIGNIGPEKALKELDPGVMARAFAVNAIGPALAAKHLAPLLPRKRRGIIAALSARVGSIGDNRLGGWYSYRASKAALNQLMHTVAIEFARTRKDAVCAVIHPGTVETGLSAPFAQGKGVPPAQAAANILEVLDGLTPADSGGFFAYDGERIVW